MIHLDVIRHIEKPVLVGSICSLFGRINNTTLRRIKRNSLYESSQSKEDPSTSTEAPQVKSMVNIGSEKCCLIEENLERIIDGTTATTTKIG